MGPDGVRRWVCYTMCAGTFAGCCDVPESTLDKTTLSQAKALDDVSSVLAKYGTMSISNPVFTTPGDAFRFEMKDGADEFYSAARTDFQGRALLFDQQSHSFGFGASVAFDPTMAAAYALQMQQYLAAVTQNAQRQAMLNDQVGLQNQAAAATRDAEIAAATRAYDTERDEAMKEKDEARRLALLRAAESKRDAAIAAAHTRYADAQKAPAAVEAGDAPTSKEFQPEEADAALGKPSAEFRKSGLSADRPSGFQGLAGSRGAPKVAPRSAIITAAGDNATKAIFNVLGNPELTSKFTGTRVMFGVSTVAVNPGWHTRKDFAADVSVQAFYGYRPARAKVVEHFLNDPRIDSSIRRSVAQTLFGGDAAKIKAAAPALENVSAANSQVIDAQGLLMPSDARGDPLTGVAIIRPDKLTATPLVTIASPITQTDAMDLATSRRQQSERLFELALALQTAGLTAQARVIDQYIKLVEQDLATATTANVINGYSHSGGLFGFQIGPRLVAVEEAVNPSAGKGKDGISNKAAQVLDRQSFPVLILYGLTQKDLLRVHIDKNGAATLYEAQLLQIVTGDWIPLDEKAASGRLTNVQREEWAKSLGLAFSPDKPAPTGLAARAVSARYKLNGSGMFQDLPVDFFEPPEDPDKPEPKTPKVTGYSPITSVTLKKDDAGKIIPAEVQLILNGENLKDVKADKIAIATGDARIKDGTTAKLVGDAIAITVTVESNKSAIIFQLPLDDGATKVILSPPFPVTVDTPPKPETPPSQINISHTTEEDQKKKTETLTFPSGTPEAVIKAFEDARRPVSVPVEKKP